MVFTLYSAAWLKMGKKVQLLILYHGDYIAFFMWQFFRKKKVSAINFDLQGTAALNVIFLCSISYLYNNLLKHAVIGNSEN